MPLYIIKPWKEPQVQQLLLALSVNYFAQRQILTHVCTILPVKRAVGGSPRNVFGRNDDILICNRLLLFLHQQLVQNGSTKEATSHYHCHLLFDSRKPIVRGEATKQTGILFTIRQLSPGAQELGGHDGTLLGLLLM